MMRMVWLIGEMNEVLDRPPHSDGEGGRLVIENIVFGTESFDDRLDLTEMAAVNTLDQIKREVRHRDNKEGG
jgi:hypothetical protein